MRMYASGNSPFCTRVTIAARLKGIEIEHVYPPVDPQLGLKNPEYLAITPIGKIPTLVTESGQVIPESAAILAYLEDRFPEPSLLAHDPGPRAFMNVVISVTDSYVMSPIFRTYAQLNPATRDPQVVAQEVKLWSTGLANLAILMETYGTWPQADAGASIADCVLAPSLHLSTRIAAMLDLDEDPIRPHQVLTDYVHWIKQHATIGPILDELTATQSANDLRAGRRSVADAHY